MQHCCLQRIQEQYERAAFIESDAESQSDGTLSVVNTLPHGRSSSNRLSYPLTLSRIWLRFQGTALWLEEGIRCAASAGTRPIVGARTTPILVVE